MSSKDLIKITEGSAVWTFTTSNEAEVYGGDTYAPRICGASELTDNAQIGKNTLDLEFPLLDSVAQHFLKSPVDFAARLDLYSKDEEGTIRAEWRGKLTKTAPGDKTIKLTFNSIFSSNKRVGARPVYQRACRHSVYGPGCTLDYNALKTAATVTAISTNGLVLTVPEAAALTPGILNAGIIEAPDGTMRYISNHSGDQVTVIRPWPSLIDAFLAASPVDVFVATGCTQGTAWCKDVFDNLLNHGGFPFIPLKNPTRSAIV